MKLGWVDYSKDERTRVIQLLNSLKSQSALDELGIGTIRDAFSDIFFPGISTLHTRAKYFVLIPYLFHDAQTKSFQKPSDVRPWIEKQEDILVRTLMKNSDPNAYGIFGSVSIRNQGSVKYKPSGTYWNGLRTFGIVLNPQLSLDDVCKITYFNSKNAKDIILKTETDDESGDDEDNKTETVCFSPILPSRGYMENVSIELTKIEATYLSDMIQSSPLTKNSFLRILLTDDSPLPADFQSIDSTKLDQDIGYKVKLAQDFADFIYGAHLLFNVIFSQEKDTDILAHFDEWYSSFTPIDLEAVILIAKCSDRTARFLRTFNQSIQNRDLVHAKECIIQRELSIKGKRSKLSYPSTNVYTKPIHAYKLYYRYPTVLRILQDIRNGLTDNE